MATIAFRVNELRPYWEKYPRLEIFHGDDVEMQFAQPFYQSWNKKFGIASPKDVASHGPWQRCPEISELPQQNNFPYDNSYDNCFQVIEPSSECEYNPLEVWGWGNREYNDNLSCQGYSQHTFQEFIARFFDIPTFDELTEMAVKSGYKRFIVKRNVELKYKFVKTFLGSSVLVAVIGNPKRIPYEVRWTNRYDSCWIKDEDVKRYKKFIKTYRYAGENGLALIGSSCFHSDLGHPDNHLAYLQRMHSEEWVDYNEPSVYSEQTKENMRKAEEARRKEQEKLNKQKQLPGYCDICGCEHAQFVNDPWRDIHGWFCGSCYSQHYCD